MGTEISKREESIKLRLQGKSYGEIMKDLNISSKGTLSYWFRNLKLPLQVRQKLAQNIELARERGLLNFNKKRTENIVAENKSLFKIAEKSISKISKTNLLLIGTALYWAEGTTRELKRGYQIISFTNSDPIMVKVFMRYLREILLVENGRIKPGIQIYPGMDEKEIRKFWSEVINLPSESFYIFRSISNASKLKRPKNFLPYGTLNIRVSDRRIFSKVKGFISGMAKKII